MMLTTSLLKPPKSQLQELRVCTNRTCRKQGSFQTLQLLTDLAPPDVPVKSCGCLGKCGAGPNVAVVPQGVIVGHCWTASRAGSVMREVAGVSECSVESSLEAVAIRKRAEVEIMEGNFDKAEELLLQAIEKKPIGGLHIIYKSRSVSRLGMGKYSLALEDARSALALAPRYPEAYICEGDALMAMGKYTEAENSYSTCLKVNPSVRCWKSFKSRVAELQEKLTAVDTACND